MLNKSIAQTAVSGFCSKKLHKQNSLYRQKRGKGWERREGFNLMIANNAEQLKPSWTMSVELMNFLNYGDKPQFHNLKEKMTTSLRNQVSQFVI